MSDLQLAALTRAVRGGSEVYSVHYACESFHEALDHPAGVSAVSVSSIPRSEDLTFSRRDSADADSAELQTLRGFYAWLQSKPDAFIVHWNMNKTEYGFTPLRNRFVFLGADPPPMHAQERLFNLDELIAHRHGEGYAPHPRLPNLLAMNGIATRYGLSGSEQAQKYAAGEHAELARCTAERAGSIATLAERFIDGDLQTELSGPAVKFAGSMIDSVEAVLEIGGRIRDIGNELGRRRAGKPTLTLTDEYDYQDVLRAQLRLFFDDVRPEDVAPINAGASSRIDFVLPDFGLAVEVKATRDSLDDRKLGEELTIDATRYRAHGKVRHLVCLVYDAERSIRNPHGLEKDLSGPRDGIAVTVRIFQ